MEKFYKIKVVFLITLIVVIITCIILYTYNKKEEIIIGDEVQKSNDIQEQQPIEICYYRSTKTSRDFYDVAWLKLNLLGEKVTGEFQNLPAEKDSKIGTFEGTVGSLDQKIMGRRAIVWWNSLAEGMNVKEELAIEFGDGSATIGFGEMINRGDGVYVYKDKNNLTYFDSLNQYDCEYLDEKLFTEKYIRDNINIIATNKPVLGGSWYVLSINVNPAVHTGEIVYEDGHIRSTASLIYSYEKDPQSILVTKFEVKN